MQLTFRALGDTIGTQLTFHQISVSWSTQCTTTELSYLQNVVLPHQEQATEGDSRNVVDLCYGSVYQLPSASRTSVSIIASRIAKTSMT